MAAEILDIMRKLYPNLVEQAGLLSQVCYGCSSRIVYGAGDMREPFCNARTAGSARGITTACRWASFLSDTAANWGGCVIKCNGDGTK